MKRIIITISNEDHKAVKTFCASEGSNIQKLGVNAFNKLFELEKANISIKTPKGKK